MKKFFLTMLIALLCSGAAYAQPTPGEARVQKVLAAGKSSKRLLTAAEIRRAAQD